MKLTIVRRIVLTLGLTVLAGFTPTVSANTLTTGLVAHWDFNGNGSDSSGHGYNLTLVGSPTFAAGRFGQAMWLDGTGSQYAVRPGDDPVFNFGATEFTVQIWANFKTHLSEQTLIEKFTGGSGPGWTLTTRGGSSSGDLQFYPVITAAASYPANQWHQYLFERSGTNGILYRDGTLISSVNFSGTLSSSANPLLIGKRNAGDGRGFYVNGGLDDAAVWNRALTPGEIASLYANGFGTAAPEPGTLLLLSIGTGLLGLARPIRSKFKQ